MRFMVLMIPGKKLERGEVPTPAQIAPMMKYNAELAKAGVLLSLDGLHPPSDAVRISFADGKPTVTDGPFAEAREVIGGYWILQVSSKAEAVDWAKKAPAAAGDVIEVRQVHEMSDFGPITNAQEGERFAEIGKHLEENRNRGKH